MKKLILIALSVITLSTLEVIGQCNSESLSNLCIPKLSTGFNFLKSYKIEKGGKIMLNILMCSLREHNT